LLIEQKHKYVTGHVQAGTPHHQRKYTKAPKHEMNYVSTEIDLVTVLEAIMTSRWQLCEKLQC